MEQAKDIEEFVRMIAQGIEQGVCVRYDIETLAYGEVHQYQLDEYDEYVEMEELPDDLDEELHDWEIDLVKYLRDTLDLPDEIDPPRTREQFEWMADFANEQSVGGRFIRDVQRALDSRHPFGTYKDVMYDYGLIDNWYRYREECCRHYVRRELGLDEE